MGRSKNEQEFLNLILKYMPSDRVLENEMLSRHTSFQIGGPADFLVLPSSFDDVAVILTLSRQLGIPLTVLGRGLSAQEQNCARYRVMQWKKGLPGLNLRWAFPVVWAARCI